MITRHHSQFYQIDDDEQEVDDDDGGDEYCYCNDKNKSSQWLPNTPFASISECLVS